MRTLSLLLLLFFSLSAEAQSVGKISGVITDAATGDPLPGASISVVGTTRGAISDADGNYFIIGIPIGTYDVQASFVGFTTETRANVAIGSLATVSLHFALTEGVGGLDEVVVEYERPLIQRDAIGVPRVVSSEEVASLPNRSVAAVAQVQSGVVSSEVATAPIRRAHDETAFSREGYAHIEENAFRAAFDHPLSTFAIDVDRASYSNIRRFLQSGQLPPVGAVRIEEMVNYFAYTYPQPHDAHPFSITTELGVAPWNPAHRLVHIGLQGYALPASERPPSNLVFLIDVSGSMHSHDKLPLVKRGLELLTASLRPEDRVAIVVYAGAAGLVLESTPGSDQSTIRQALDRLRAGGGTAGAAGIRLAYQVAQQHFIEGGNNRVILATDGDFNVGVSSNSELIPLIEKQREAGTFLTVLGFGTGNLQDHRMEQIANHGNGTYYYIDSEREAEKVFVDELGGTLFTIAKDVKIQVEFNPLHVAAYRLIGYENRALAAEDFRDDQKDAGELGAGHTVTALYEVIPAGAETSTAVRAVGHSRYLQTSLTSHATSDEWMIVRLRYKAPDADTSQEFTHPLVPHLDRTPSENFTFSAAVAAFGMLLRESEHRGTTTASLVYDLAQASMGADRNGHRREFLALVRAYQHLADQLAEAER